MATPNKKINSTTIERVAKRAASDELGSEAKKTMSDHNSYEKQAPSVVPKSVVQQKFVSAAEMAANARTSIQTMPEISDEELLEMTLKFEMEHPE